jgi:hypothetical protein
MPSSEIADLTEDTTPDSTDVIYAQNAGGTVDKRVPLSALPIPTAVQTALDAKVGDTGNETIAGVKTFSSDPIVPAEAYGETWNGSNEVPTKNDLFDALELLDETISTNDDAVTAHTSDSTAVHGITNTLALPEVWVSNGAGGYVLTSTIQRIYVGPDDPASASPGGRSQNYDVWIDTTV